jgi:uncharacterized protein involved in outer membrane biogenesis
MKKILIVGPLATLLVLASALALVIGNLDPLINDQREQISQLATERFGRTVSFGPVQTTWKEGLSARLTDIRLSAHDPSAPPQLSLDDIQLKVNLWKAITSLGKNLEVDAFVLHHPVIRVSRSKDGKWDFEDIPEHLKATAPAEEPEEAEDADEPMDKEALQGLRIAGLAIERGTLEIDDQMLGRKLVVDGLDHSAGKGPHRHPAPHA